MAEDPIAQEIRYLEWLLAQAPEPRPRRPGRIITLDVVIPPTAEQMDRRAHGAD